MQPGGANYRWEFAVPDGDYRVTIAAGDPNPVYDSTHSIRAEAHRWSVRIVPTASDRQRAGTSSVRVGGWPAQLDAVGGTNTKIAYIDIEQVNAVGPYFTSMSPERRESEREQGGSIVLSPSVSVDPATVNADTLVVTDPAGQELTGSYNSDAAGGVVNFTPSPSPREEHEVPRGGGWARRPPAELRSRASTTPSPRGNRHAGRTGHVHEDQGRRRTRGHIVDRRAGQRAVRLHGGRARSSGIRCGPTVPRWRTNAAGQGLAQQPHDHRPRVRPPPPRRT